MSKRFLLRLDFYISQHVEEDQKERGITSLGGLPLYLGLAHVIGLTRSVREHIRIGFVPKLLDGA